MTLAFQLFKNSNDPQEKLRLNLHSLSVSVSVSVSELLEYGRYCKLSGKKSFVKMKSLIKPKGLIFLSDEPTIFLQVNQ
jgi:hypothetical protein